jgi:hypothetical protein
VTGKSDTIQMFVFPLPPAGAQAGIVYGWPTILSELGLWLEIRFRGVRLGGNLRQGLGTGHEQPRPRTVTDEHDQNLTKC